MVDPRGAHPSYSPKFSQFNGFFFFGKDAKIVCLTPSSKVGAPSYGESWNPSLICMKVLKVIPHVKAKAILCSYVSLCREGTLFKISHIATMLTRFCTSLTEHALVLVECMDDKAIVVLFIARQICYIDSSFYQEKNRLHLCIQ